MPIVTLQRQFRELGRIRLGEQVPVKGKPGVTRPAALSTFRLTSKERDQLEHAATIYGGEVRPWTNGQDGDAFELVTTTAELDIIIPPGAPISQWNEMWGAGGCVRRCDGVREWLNDVPCQCPADPGERNELAARGNACKTTTRLSVALPRLLDVGIWLLVSHGYYAAVELMGTADILRAQAAAGVMLPAILAIEHRQVKRPNQARKDFIVPIIRIPATMAALGSGGSTLPALESGALPPLAAPVRAVLPPGPALPATAQPFASTQGPAIDDMFADDGDPGPAAEIRPQSDSEAARAASSAPPAPVAAHPVAASQARESGVPPLADILRDTAAASTLAGAMTDPQKVRLAEVLRPLGFLAMKAGLQVAFGDVTNAEGKLVLSSAQANTVIAAAGDEAFEARWRAMVEEAAVGV